MADGCNTCGERRARDWASDRRILAAVWGLPGMVMLAAMLLEPMPRTIIWVAMLIWMGVACIGNARRCSRTHCRFTGPFFLLMATLVVAYAAEMLHFGEYGWPLLGAATLIGFAALWWGSERMFGMFR